MNVIYRERALAYPQPQFRSNLQGACPSLPPTTLFYRERALTYPHHSMLHGACLCLPPTTLFYRERALAYPKPQFYDMWWSRGFHLYHNLQEMWWKIKLGRTGRLHLYNTLGAVKPKTTILKRKQVNRSDKSSILHN